MTPDNFTSDDTTTPHELAGAYALNALPADEVATFEAHLASCADCTEEVASLQDVAATLASLATEEAPAAMRASILTAITDVEQVAAARTTSTSTMREATPPSPATTVAPPAPTDTADNVVSLDEHRRLRRTTRLVTSVAAALALVLGGVGLWANGLDSQLRGRDQASEQLASVLNAPDVQFQTVDGANLVLSPTQQQAVFAAGSLDAPDSSSVLQMWVIDASGPVSAGLVDDPSQPALLDIPVPAGAAVGITVEPAGGSDQPTTDPVVVFQT